MLRTRHTTVAAYTALILALGGGATANAQRITQFFTGENIIDHTITRDDLAGASVASPEVVNGSLKAEDIANDAVGPAELNVKVKIVTAMTDWTEKKRSKSATAVCPAGYTVLGGGARLTEAERGSSIVESRPEGTNAWRVTVAAISYPAQKTNWYHSHRGDAATDVVWKDWVWRDDFTPSDVDADVYAICAEL